MNHSQIAASFPISSLPIIGVDRYLAVPYRKHGRDLKGWDCFGCVRYILAVHAGIILPAFDGCFNVEIIRQAKRREWIEQETPQPFDIVTMNVVARRRIGVHLGVMVSASRVLHCDSGIGTVCVPLDHYSLRHRVETIYRYAGKNQG